MKHYSIRNLVAIVLVLTGILAIAQTKNDAPLSKSAPTDRPHNIRDVEQLVKYDELISPSVRKALETLPEAKMRYLKGLGKGQAFFLTTRIYDDDGRYEQIFVRVTNWNGSNVQGTIANELNIVRSYAYGQPINFPESAVLDWLITNPDGTEEGNYVGKLLDSLDSSISARENRYEMKGHGISVALPNDWLFTSLSGGAAFRAQENCMDRDFCKNIVFTFIANSSELSEDEFGSMLISQLPKRFKKFELNRQSDTTVNTVKFKAIDYSVEQPDGKFNSTTLLKCYNERVMIVNYTAKDVKKRSYKGDRDLFFDIIGTIAIQE